VAPCKPAASPAGISGAFTYNATAGDLTDAGGGTATLAAGSYCFHHLNVSGGSKVVVSGPVTIQLTGQLTASASTINGAGSATNLRITSSFAANNGVTISGVGAVSGSIDAPATGVTVSGGSSMTGVVLGRT